MPELVHFPLFLATFFANKLHNLLNTNNNSYSLQLYRIIDDNSTVNWKTATKFGRFSSEAGQNTIFTCIEVGSERVIGEQSGLRDGKTGDIICKPGPPTSLVIVDQASGEGKLIPDYGLQLIPGQVQNFYAILKDDFDNFVKNVTPTWNYDPIVSASSKEVADFSSVANFAKAEAQEIGFFTVRASHQGLNDKVESIEVKVPVPHRVTFQRSPAEKAQYPAGKDILPSILVDLQNKDGQQLKKLAGKFLIELVVKSGPGALEFLNDGSRITAPIDDEGVAEFANVSFKEAGMYVVEAACRDQFDQNHCPNVLKAESFVFEVIAGDIASIVIN